MKKHIIITFFALFCICSFLGGVHFNNFINNWDLLILTFGLLGFYLCLLENRITKELFLFFFLIILVPLIFFSVLSLIDTRLVSSIKDWIGFLGAYLGIIGTIGAIWWQLNEEKSKRQQNIFSYIKYTSGEYLDFIRNNLSYFFSLLYLTNEQTILKVPNNFLKISMEIDIDNYYDILSSEKGANFLDLKKETDKLNRMLENIISNIDNCIKFSKYLRDIRLNPSEFREKFPEFQEKFSDFDFLLSSIAPILANMSANNKVIFPDFELKNLENKKFIYSSLKTILKENKHHDKFLTMMELTLKIQSYFSKYFVKILISPPLSFKNDDRDKLHFILNYNSTCTNFTILLLNIYKASLKIQS